jgi:hypothetical protein
VEVTSALQLAQVQRIGAGQSVRIGSAGVQPEHIASDDAPSPTRASKSYTRTISTADGRGGDATVAEFASPPSGWGKHGSFWVRFKNKSRFRNDWGLLRFDLTGIEPGTIMKATLKLIPYRRRTDTGHDTLRVYAVNDDAPHEDDWDEATVKFDDAPGLRSDGDGTTPGLIADQTTKIGDWRLPTMGQGRPVSFSHPNLVQFLNRSLQNDSDKCVSLLLQSATVRPHEKHFATKEATRLGDDAADGTAGQFAPVLELVLKREAPDESTADESR